MMLVHGLSVGVLLLISGLVESCCLPPQYQANQRLMKATVKHGQLSVIQGTLHYWYDTVSKRENFVEDLVVDGNPMTVRVLKDYNVTMTKYVITARHCTKSSLDVSSFKQGCIPDGASKTVDSYFGLFPGNMKFNTYNTSVGSVTSSITTTPDCVPVFDVSVVPTGSSPYMQAVQLYNFTVGIGDETVFDIPSICQPPVDIGK